MIGDKPTTLTFKPGAWSQAQGNADRFNEGKAELSFLLIGSEVSACEAKVWAMGAKKYSRGNWQKGQLLSTCMDSVLRHAAAIINGEMIDPESGLPHVWHLITASKIAAHSYLTKPELNDITGNTDEQ